MSHKAEKSSLVCKLAPKIVWRHESRTTVNWAAPVGKNLKLWDQSRGERALGCAQLAQISDYGQYQVIWA